MKKKIVGIMLSTVLAVSMLAGCGQSAAPAAPAAPAAEEKKEEAPAAEEAAETADAAAEAAGDTDLSTKKVGICIYQFSDNFMTLFRQELENYLISLGFSKDNIKIVDGANDQGTQTGQIDSFIAEGVDVLIINPVNSSSAETITDKVVAAGIPLVYMNREPSADEQKRWADNNWDVCYVGCDARQSGTMQGEMLVDLGMDKIDLNGDGKIQYIMIQGDPENVDAQYRTEFSVKALTDAGIEVEELFNQVGNWQQDQANTLVTNALTQFGDQIEVVFCNNDGMAMGAIQSIEGAGRKVGEDIFLVGVDAIPEALDAIEAGNLSGTVFNDHLAQSHNSADAAVNYITGKGNDHNIQCDYVKVTPDMVSEIKGFLGI